MSLSSPSTTASVSAEAPSSESVSGTVSSGGSVSSGAVFANSGASRFAGLTPGQPSIPARRAGTAHAAYRQAGSVATPGRSVSLLYERLLRDLDDADRAIEARLPAIAHEALVHAQKIVEGLDLCLDRTTWDGADNLSALYRFLLDELTQANVRKDSTRVQNCRAVIGPLAEAWREAWAMTAKAS